MNRVITRPSLRPRRHLRQTIGARIQQHDFDTRLHAITQDLPICETGVDKGRFAHGWRRGEDAGRHWCAGQNQAQQPQGGPRRTPGSR
ncbi:hypothetical protein [Thiobaca trueperi]|uniref:hypothetical protein n=1 Tax=Thiobaca trueperi TaxID=127458 RepID=UPI001FB297FA|nr:hypothetical protein [Thiobaca trueperi]